MADSDNSGRKADAPSAVELIALPWQEATRRKWAAGRAAYGAKWKGGPPLAEMFGELADALNYNRAAEAQGLDPDKAARWQTELARIAQEVQAEWQNGGGASGHGASRSANPAPPSAPDFEGDS